MPLNQTDHDNVSWGTMSEDWPRTTVQAYAKYVFANKAKVIPYGSYVLMDSNTKHPHLRVETLELLEKLDTNFNIVRDVILQFK